MGKSDEKYRRAENNLRGKNKEVRSKVFVRLRPLNLSVINKRAHAVYSCPNKKTVQLDVVDPRLSISAEKRMFSLSGSCFDENACNSAVYVETAQPHVFGLTEGISSCVMVYGSSGSGKSFSLYGTLDTVGMVPSAIYDLLCHIASYIEGENSGSKKPKAYVRADELDSTQRKGNYEFTVRMAFVEVFGERVIDLLHCCDRYAPDSFIPTLSVAKSNKDTYIVEGLSEIDITSIEEAVRHVARAASFKKIRDEVYAGNTSHSVFSLTVEKAYSKNMESSGITVYKSTLQFVELSGVEKLLKATNAFENPMMRSTFFTTECLLRLARREGHEQIPWAKSVLTKLLRSTCIGKVPLSLIITIDPSDRYVPISFPLLNFASSLNFPSIQVIYRSIEMKESHIYKIHQEILRACEEVGFTMGLLKGMFENPQSKMWWFPTKEDRLSKIATLNRAIKANQAKIMLGTAGDWEFLEGARLSTLIGILRPFKRERAFLKGALEVDRPPAPFLPHISRMEYDAEPYTEMDLYDIDLDLHTKYMEPEEFMSLGPTIAPITESAFKPEELDKSYRITYSPPEDTVAPVHVSFSKDEDGELNLTSSTFDPFLNVGVNNKPVHQRGSNALMHDRPGLAASDLFSSQSQSPRNPVDKLTFDNKLAKKQHKLNDIMVGNRRGWKNGRLFSPDDMTRLKNRKELLSPTTPCTPVNKFSELKENGGLYPRFQQQAIYQAEIPDSECFKYEGSKNNSEKVSLDGHQPGIKTLNTPSFHEMITVAQDIEATKSSIMHFQCQAIHQTENSGSLSADYASEDESKRTRIEENLTTNTQDNGNLLAHNKEASLSSLQNGAEHSNYGNISCIRIVSESGKATGYTLRPFEDPIPINNSAENSSGVPIKCAMDHMNESLKLLRKSCESLKINNKITEEQEHFDCQSTHGWQDVDHGREKIVSGDHEYVSNDLRGEEDEQVVHEVEEGSEEPNIVYEDRLEYEDDYFNEQNVEVETKNEDAIKGDDTWKGVEENEDALLKISSKLRNDLRTLIDTSALIRSKLDGTASNDASQLEGSQANHEPTLFQHGGHGNLPNDRTLPNMGDKFNQLPKYDMRKTNPKPNLYMDDESGCDIEKISGRKSNTDLSLLAAADEANAFMVHMKQDKMKNFEFEAMPMKVLFQLSPSSKRKKKHHRKTDPSSSSSSSVSSSDSDSRSSTESHKHRTGQESRKHKNRTSLKRKNDLKEVGKNLGIDFPNKMEPWDPASQAGFCLPEPTDLRNCGGNGKADNFFKRTLRPWVGVFEPGPKQIAGNLSKQKANTDERVRDDLPEKPWLVAARVRQQVLKELRQKLMQEEETASGYEKEYGRREAGRKEIKLSQEFANLWKTRGMFGGAPEECGEKIIEAHPTHGGDRRLELKKSKRPFGEKKDMDFPVRMFEEEKSGQHGYDVEKKKHFTPTENEGKENYSSPNVPNAFISPGENGNFYFQTNGNGNPWFHGQLNSQVMEQHSIEAKKYRELVGISPNCRVVNIIKRDSKGIPVDLGTAEARRVVYPPENPMNISIPLSDIHGLLKKHTPAVAEMPSMAFQYPGISKSGIVAVPMNVERANAYPDILPSIRSTFSEKKSDRIPSYEPGTPGYKQFFCGSGSCCNSSISKPTNTNAQIESSIPPPLISPLSCGFLTASVPSEKAHEGHKPSGDSTPTPDASTEHRCSATVRGSECVSGAFSEWGDVIRGTSDVNKDPSPGANTRSLDVEQIKLCKEKYDESYVTKASEQVKDAVNENYAQRPSQKLLDLSGNPSPFHRRRKTKCPPVRFSSASSTSGKSEYQTRVYSPRSMPILKRETLTGKDGEMVYMMPVVNPVQLRQPVTTVQLTPVLQVAQPTQVTPLMHAAPAAQPVQFTYVPQMYIGSNPQYLRHS